MLAALAGFVLSCAAAAPAGAAKLLDTIELTAGSGIEEDTDFALKEDVPYHLEMDGTATYENSPGNIETFDPFYVFECIERPSDPVFDCPTPLPFARNAITAGPANTSGRTALSGVVEEGLPDFQRDNVYDLTLVGQGTKFAFAPGVSEGTSGGFTIDVFGPDVGSEKKVLDFSVSQNGPPLNSGRTIGSKTLLSGSVGFRKLRPEGSFKGTLKNASGSHVDTVSAGSLDPAETSEEGFAFVQPGTPTPATYKAKENGKKTLSIEVGVDEIALGGDDCPFDARAATLNVVLKDDGAKDTLDFEPGDECKHNEKYKSGRGSKLQIRIDEAR